MIFRENKEVSSCESKSFCSSSSAGASLCGDAPVPPPFALERKEGTNPKSLTLLFLVAGVFDVADRSID